MTRKPYRNPAPATKGIRIHWPRLYDFINRLHFLGREARFREATVELAGIAHGHTVLDVGCGTGNLTLAIKHRAGAEAGVYGIDAAPEMIQEAERKAARKRLEVHYKAALIEDIPFPDHKFDVVVSSLMLHHLPRNLKRRGIAEISRVLKPGGRFVAVDLDPPWLGNLRIVEEAMRVHGFTEIRRGRMKFRTMFLPIHTLSGRGEDQGKGDGAVGTEGGHR